MHDPMSVIKDFKIRDKVIATLWHVDPCTDGTDDSCGNFKRARHGDKEMLRKIQNDFDWHITNRYWFTADGIPKFSTIGLLVQMYQTAGWLYFKRNRKKLNRFMRKHIVSIINLAENPFDCIGSSITDYYKIDDTRELINEHRRLAAVIYGDILRKDAKWWQSPKFHVQHWKITFRIFRKKKKPNPNYDANLRATV